MPRRDAWRRLHPTCHWVRWLRNASKSHGHSLSNGTCRAHRRASRVKLLTRMIVNGRGSFRALYGLRRRRRLAYSSSVGADRFVSDRIRASVSHCPDTAEIGAFLAVISPSLSSRRKIEGARSWTFVPRSSSSTAGRSERFRPPYSPAPATPQSGSTRSPAFGLSATSGFPCRPATP
jgi:hypothetical protein